MVKQDRVMHGQKIDCFAGDREKSFKGRDFGKTVGHIEDSLEQSNLCDGHIGKMGLKGQGLKLL